MYNSVITYVFETMIKYAILNAIKYVEIIRWILKIYVVRTGGGWN
jgi:hypothetical protein